MRPHRCSGHPSLGRGHNSKGHWGGREHLRKSEGAALVVSGRALLAVAGMCLAPPGHRRLSDRGAATLMRQHGFYEGVSMDAPIRRYCRSRQISCSMRDDGINFMAGDRSCGWGP